MGATTKVRNSFNELTSFQELALEGKIYVDFENQIIVPTSYEVDE